MRARQYGIAPISRRSTALTRHDSTREVLIPTGEQGKWQRIMDELESAKLTRFGKSRPETKIVATILHDWEHVVAAVYGYSPQGFAMLTATDRRVLFVSSKLLFTHVDEAPFHSIEGVSVEVAVFLATLTIHTKFGSFSIQTFNFTGATKFADYVEQMIEERKQNKQEEEI